MVSGVNKYVHLIFSRYLMKAKKTLSWKPGHSKWWLTTRKRNRLATFPTQFSISPSFSVFVSTTNESVPPHWSVWLHPSSVSPFLMHLTIVKKREPHAREKRFRAKNGARALFWYDWSNGRRNISAGGKLKKKKRSVSNSFPRFSFSRAIIDFQS